MGCLRWKWEKYVENFSLVKNIQLDKNLIIHDIESTDLNMMTDKWKNDDANSASIEFKRY